MQPERFGTLDLNQQHVMLLAMHIRNRLENFHADHQILDGLMPELNSTIRYAIYDFYENMVANERNLAWLATMIPDYWEIPGVDPQPTFSGEFLWEGKPIGEAK